MTATEPGPSQGQPSANASTLVLKFASGPIVALALYLVPYGGVPLEGRVALGIFGWMVMGWMARPVPWAVSSILPLILFPVFNVMNVGETVALYGQNIFFWIWGTILMGYAMDHHGLAKRFALWFMSLKWVNGSASRTAFGFMLVTGLISMMLSDAATVAVMIPVAVSLVAFVRSVQPQAGPGKSNFGAFLALGALYGSVAGGTATIAGIPHNALSVALLEELNGRTLGWFEWMFAGFPVFVVLLLVFYFVLRFFLPPEFKVVPGGVEFLRQERLRLGPLSSGERSTLFVFVMMVTGSEVLPLAVANTIYYLWSHPEQRRRVQQDLGLVPHAFAESLRYDQPTNLLGRRLMKDTQVQGQSLRAGQGVMFLWASGNRDELEFDEADRFDIDRRPRRSLSYGHGIHQCIGERLGNLEGRVLLEEILAAAPDFEVRPEGVERNYGEFLHGHHKMPIEFTPGPLPKPD